jgi:hypothetical protein
LRSLAEVEERVGTKAPDERFGYIKKIFGIFAEGKVE